jgi:lipopolysaccharide export LptBFGC system permease protein LptF
MYGQNLLMVILRTGLYVALVVIMLYDWLVASPRIRQFRQEYLDNADNPDIANPAKEKFDQYHRDSVTMLSVQLFMLLGMILFSGNLYYN